MYSWVVRTVGETASRRVVSDEGCDRREQTGTPPGALPATAAAANTENPSGSRSGAAGADQASRSDWVISL